MAEAAVDAALADAPEAIEETAADPVCEAEDMVAPVVARLPLDVFVPVDTADVPPNVAAAVADPDPMF